MIHALVATLHSLQVGGIRCLCNSKKREINSLYVQNEIKSKHVKLAEDIRTYFCNRDLALCNEGKKPKIILPIISKDSIQKKLSSFSWLPFKEFLWKDYL